MDKITESLYELVNTRDINNWILAETLVTNMEIDYKYQLLYMFKKRIPRLCPCDVSYVDSIFDKFQFIADYIKKFNLKQSYRSSWSWGITDKDWINQYIVKTSIYNIKQDGCPCDLEKEKSETQGYLN